MTTVYVVGSLRSTRIVEVAMELRQAGFDVIDDWWSAGRLADIEWTAHEKIRGRGFKEALKGHHAKAVYALDKGLLDSSDLGVIVHPAGKSANREAGYLYGCGKPVFDLLEGDDPEQFDVMILLGTDVVSSVPELVEKIHATYS